MKIKQFIIILVTICTPVFSVADCYTSLRQKAIDAYNRAEYDRAIATFQSAKEDCPDTPSNHDIDSWIKKCNAAKNKPVTTKQTTKTKEVSTSKQTTVTNTTPTEIPPAPIADKYFLQMEDIAITLPISSDCNALYQSYNKQLLEMCSVYADKLVEFVENHYKWTNSLVEFRRAEIEEMYERIFMFRSSVISDLEACNKKKSVTTITGTVVDSKGRPIIGASVIESGTSNGCITDFNGKFTLKVKENVILYISCKGYSGKNANAKNGMLITLDKRGK